MVLLIAKHRKLLVLSKNFLCAILPPDTTFFVCQLLPPQNPRRMSHLGPERGPQTW